MRDLINVAMSPSQPQKFIDHLFKYWTRAHENAVPEFKPERVSYGADGTPTIPFAQASEIMLKQLAIMKKVNRHG